jgi:sugar phosphate isomerase/epimerase
MGLKRIAFKDMHLPLDSTPAAIESAVAKVKAAGLELYGCGVVYMRTEAEVRQAFDYAKAAGMSVIIGVPNHELLDLAEAKAKSYDIRVAIHNHGPGDRLYPSPASVHEKIESRDRRLGLCLDVGHTQRLGVDPASAARQFADRLIDLHIKDVSAPTPQGHTVEIGRGVIDVPRLLRTLVEINFQGTAALEYEKDADDPLAGAAESIGFLRGVMALL